ncbi:MAG: dihydroorotase [Methylohalobius sp.]|nr:dihydroorotase [Methylohalobius sp.]
MLTFTRPDDWHVHLRDGPLLRQVAIFSARQFRRVLVMPNLQPPIVSVAHALAYRQRIIQALPSGIDFEPYFSLYLTSATSPKEVADAANCPQILGFKLYPAGVTTHSEAGVTNIKKIYPILELIERYDLVLQVHGEVADPTVDIFDRERVFLEQELAPIIDRFPGLRIVLEHITTQEAVEFVQAAHNKVAATITPQHLRYNRNALFAGGIRPHAYCLPVLKREHHRQALLSAVSSGSPKFFLGTDSAPHLRQRKEAACGCAGCFTAPIALELYAEAFEEISALDKLEGFASFYGADFYRLPRNQNTVTLRRLSWTVPLAYDGDAGEIVPLEAGNKLSWQLAYNAPSDSFSNSSNSFSNSSNSSSRSGGSPS